MRTYLKTRRWLPRDVLASHPEPLDSITWTITIDYAADPAPTPTQ